jgi:hypothetical protein
MCRPATGLVLFQLTSRHCRAGLTYTAASRLYSIAHGFIDVDIIRQSWTDDC